MAGSTSVEEEGAPEEAPALVAELVGVELLVVGVLVDGLLVDDVSAVVTLSFFAVVIAESPPLQWRTLRYRCHQRWS
jgi:hypothetical protein